VLYLKTLYMNYLIYIYCTTSMAVTYTGSIEEGRGKAAPGFLVFHIGVFPYLEVCSNEPKLANY